jgi:hypothetical protein
MEIYRLSVVLHPKTVPECKNKGLTLHKSGEHSAFDFRFFTSKVRGYKFSHRQFVLDAAVEL